MNTWLKRGLLLGAGGAAGFAYYYYVGCVSGTCPITSNPYISTGYGMMIGALLGWGKPAKRTTSQE
jgi:phage shock protein E